VDGRPQEELLNVGEEEVLPRASWLKLKIDGGLWAPVFVCESRVYE